MKNGNEANTQRYPRPVVIIPSVWKRLKTLAIGVVFVIGGIWMESSAGHHDKIAHYIGIISIVFFGAGTLACMIELLPNACFLKLDTKTFTIVRYFRPQVFRWNELSEFFVSYSLHFHRQEAVRASAPEKNIWIPDYFSDPGDLASLLNRWRTHASYSDA